MCHLFVNCITSLALCIERFRIQAMAADLVSRLECFIHLCRAGNALYWTIRHWLSTERAVVIFKGFYKKPQQQEFLIHFTDGKTLQTQKLITIIFTKLNSMYGKSSLSTKWCETKHQLVKNVIELSDKTKPYNYKSLCLCYRFYWRTALENFWIINYKSQIIGQRKANHFQLMRPVLYITVFFL